MANHGYPGQPPGPMPPGGGGGYEFSEAENLIVGKAGQRSSLWGLISFGTGVLMLVAFVATFLFREQLHDALIQAEQDPQLVTIAIVAYAPLALVNLAIAAFYLGAGKAMKSVVETQGNDVQHMLAALQKLANAFLMEVLVSLAAVCIGFVMGFWLAMQAPEPESPAVGVDAESETDGDDAEEEDGDTEGEGDTEDEEDEEGEEGEEGETAAAGDTEAAAEGVESAEEGEVVEIEGESAEADAAGEDGAEADAAGETAEPAGEEPTP